MTKVAALHKFFSGFGIPAYTATSVPGDVVFPYLTYTPITSAWDGESVSLTVNLWYYTTSEAIPNAKAQELSDAIGMGGILLPCDGGAIWLKRGSPWCQNIQEASGDQIDNNIKRRYINVTADFFTLN